MDYFSLKTERLAYQGCENVTIPQEFVTAPPRLSSPGDKFSSNPSKQGFLDMFSKPKSTSGINYSFHLSPS